MIIADTSVWIDYFNGKHTQHTDYLDDSINEGIVAIGDLILLEILQGFRNDKDYKLARKHLSSLDQYDMLGVNSALKASEYYRALRKKGITIRKTADVIIATFCIEKHFPLLFTDRDFSPFIQYSGLTDALSLKH